MLINIEAIFQVSWAEGFLSIAIFKFDCLAGFPHKTREISRILDFNEEAAIF